MTRACALRLAARAEVGANAADYALPIHVTTFFKAPGVTLPEFERRQHDILLDLGARPLRCLTRGAAPAVLRSRARVRVRAACAGDIIEAAGVPLAVPSSRVEVTRADAAAGDAGGAAVPPRAARPYSG